MPMSCDGDLPRKKRHKANPEMVMAGAPVGLGPDSTKNKPCMFLCCGAIKGKTASPLDPSQTIEWEYTDGRGAADLWCANTFRSKYRHKFDRSALVQDMRNSKDTMDLFMKCRQQIIERAKRKHANGNFRRHSETPKAKKKLTRSRQYEEALLPPAPDVLPWAEYQQTVSPSVQKKLGHKKQLLNGLEVVIMFGPQLLVCIQPASM